MPSKPLLCADSHPGYAAASDPVRLTTMPVRVFGTEVELLYRTAPGLPAAPGPARFAGMSRAQCLTGDWELV
jgi:hypothetical protein